MTLFHVGFLGKAGFVLSSLGCASCSQQTDFGVCHIRRIAKPDGSLWERFSKFSKKHMSEITVVQEHVTTDLHLIFASIVFIIIYLKHVIYYRFCMLPLRSFL